MLSKLKDIVEKFIDAKISSPRLEANMLLKAAKDEAELDEFVRQRLLSKPICKIIGSKGFYKHNFIVSEDVLSPRPDTEVLVERAIEIIKDKDFKSILELGVGSGCILLSIVSDCPNVSGFGIDASQKALDIAKKNALSLELYDRVKLIKHSWFDEDLVSNLGQKFDMIVSNPPYIPIADIKNLDIDVKDYDPMLALDGGYDGLDHYRQIAFIAMSLLNEKGSILLEIGIGQEKDVVEIFEKENFFLLEIVKDLSGINRCIVFELNK